MSEPAADNRRAFFAACPLGVSELLASELRALGIDVEREHPAGVSFAGPLTRGYRACLYSRTASRVLLTLARRRCTFQRRVLRVRARDAVGAARRGRRHARYRYRRRGAVVGATHAPSRRNGRRMRSSTGCRNSRAGVRPSIHATRTCGSACVSRAKPRRWHRLERRAVAPPRLSAIGGRGAASRKTSRQRCCCAAAGPSCGGRRRIRRSDVRVRDAS